jgi:hypothetical protein
MYVIGLPQSTTFTTYLTTYILYMVLPYPIHCYNYHSTTKTSERAFRPPILFEKYLTLVPLKLLLHL